eukprot:gene3837-4780_t
MISITNHHEAVPSSASVNSQVQGNLYKKGSSKTTFSRSGWKKRWFVLDVNNNQLKYYKNASDTQPKGMIQMESVDAVTKVASSSSLPSTQSNNNNNNGKKYYFNVLTKLRTYYFYSELESEREYWLNHLNHCVVSIKDPDTLIALQQQQQIQQETLDEYRPRSFTSPIIQSTNPTTVVIPVTSNSNINENDFFLVSTSPQSNQQQQPPQNNINITAQNIKSSATNFFNNILNNNNNQNNNNSNNNNKPGISSIKLCGAKIRDHYKNHGNGYITSIVAITRSKIWTGDSQGYLATWNISRSSNGLDDNNSAPIERLKKGAAWKTHSQSITSLVYIPEQKIVYSCGLDCCINGWRKSDNIQVFSFTARVPIFSMIELKESQGQLLYCGASENSTTVNIFDTKTKMDREIPFPNFIDQLKQQSPRDLNNNNQNRKTKEIRKFNRISKSDDRVLIGTNYGEIIVWSPWDSSQTCQIFQVEGDITAMAVIGNSIWVCSKEHSNQGMNLFSMDVPCTVAVYDLFNLTKIRSFESSHPIFNLNLVNGYIWAICSTHVSVYHPDSGQTVFETIDLPEDVNLASLNCNGQVWVGGSFLYRFQLFDHWYNNLTQDELYPDVTDYDRIKSVLKKFKKKLLYHPSCPIYDNLLRIGENQNLLPEHLILICESLRFFYSSCRDLIKKEQTLSSLLSLSKSDPPTICSKDAHRFLQEILIDTPKLNDTIGKLGGMVVDKLNSNSSPIEDPYLILYLIISESTSSSSNDFYQLRRYKKNPQLQQQQQQQQSTQLDSFNSNTPTSPIIALIQSLNSILHTLQNTALKSAKITITDISLPKEFTPFDLNDSSFIRIFPVFPPNNFRSQIAIEIAPKNMVVKLSVQIKGLSSVVTISELSIKGIITLGFEIGTANPQWISFEKEPTINFKIDSTNILSIGIDNLLQPLIMRAEAWKRNPYKKSDDISNNSSIKQGPIMPIDVETLGGPGNIQIPIPQQQQQQQGIPPIPSIPILKQTQNIVPMASMINQTSTLLPPSPGLVVPNVVGVPIEVSEITHTTPVTAVTTGQVTAIPSFDGSSYTISHSPSIFSSQHLPTLVQPQPVQPQQQSHPILSQSHLVPQPFLNSLNGSNGIEMKDLKKTGLINNNNMNNSSILLKSTPGGGLFAIQQPSPRLLNQSNLFQQTLSPSLQQSNSTNVTPVMCPPISIVEDAGDIRTPSPLQQHHAILINDHLHQSTKGLQTPPPISVPVKKKSRFNKEKMKRFKKSVYQILSPDTSLPVHIVDNDQMEKTVIPFLMELGRALLMSGVPSHRLEYELTLISSTFGIDGHFFTTPTGIFFSFGSPHTILSPYTHLLRITSTDYNMGRLIQLEELADEVIYGRIDCGEGLRRLKNILRAPPLYNVYLTTLSFLLSSFAIAFFLKAGWVEVGAISFVGFYVGLLYAAAGRWPTIGRVLEALSACGGAIIASFINAFIYPVHIFMVTLGGIIALAPGLSLTISVAEISTRNLVSGNARLMGVFSCLLQLTFGIALGTRLSAKFIPIRTELTPDSFPSWTMFLAVPVAAISFAIQMKVNPKQIWVITLASVLGILGGNWGNSFFGQDVGSFFGSCIICMLGNIYARFSNSSSAVPIMSGIILLVPGSMGVKGLFSVSTGDVAGGIALFGGMFMVATSLAMGLLVANLIIRPHKAL